MRSGTRVRVLVVDDSALVRSLLRAIIDDCEDLECIGTAPDPLVAREMIRTLDPDVLTLDVEMPRMDGLDFLEKLMRLRPMPVVMVSSLTERGSDVALRALELGAVDVIGKPRLDIAAGLDAVAEEIRDRIRAAALARVRARIQPASPAVAPPARAPVKLGYSTTEKLIAIGASTGGTEAIKEVLTSLPADSPGVVITQHMPERFTRSFAERLDRLSALTVKEAEDGDRILTGHAYVAPGSAHLLVERSGAYYVARLSDAGPVNRHRPSVDVLFESVARVAGANAVGALLTGMGKDGAAGLLAMRRSGAYTVAQDEASCVVYGMPREAVQIGAAADELPLGEIAERLLQSLRRCSTAGLR